MAFLEYARRNCVALARFRHVRAVHEKLKPFKCTFDDCRGHFRIYLLRYLPTARQLYSSTSYDPRTTARLKHILPRQPVLSSTTEAKPKARTNAHRLPCVHSSNLVPWHALACPGGTLRFITSMLSLFQLCTPILNNTTLITSSRTNAGASPLCQLKSPIGRFCNDIQAFARLCRQPTSMSHRLLAPKHRLLHRLLFVRTHRLLALKHRILRQVTEAETPDRTSVV